MAKVCRLGPLRRLASVAQTFLVRTGLVPGFSYILTTVGRKTGKRRSTPVTVLEQGAGTGGWCPGMGRSAGCTTPGRRGG